MLIAVLAGLSIAVRAESAVTDKPIFEPRTCTGDNLTAGFRCGDVEVPEDWSHPAGRQIRLNVLIIPARTQPSVEDPIVFLAGGPGTPATDYARAYLADAAPYRDKRDVVLFDMRGTGGSGALRCPAAEPPRPDAASAYDNPYPPAAIRACLDSLTRNASPQFYNTSAAVRDLDAVRIALGHERINLRALSYGTTYALAYMHAYPAQMRAAVLESVAPPANMPATMFGPSAQRGLDALFDACARQPDCHTRYPNPRQDLKRALAILSRDRGLTANADGKPVRFALEPVQFLEELRGPLSVSVLARGVPKLLHEAATGNFQLFVDMTLAGKLRANSFARGLYFSVICTGDFMHGNLASMGAAQRRTLFGDYKLRLQQAVCNVWPKAKLPTSFYAGFSSAIPTIFLSGQLDPVTPPAWATAVANRFTHARQIFLLGMGHIPASADEVACITTLETSFFDRPDTRALDASCASSLQIGAFD